MKLDFLNVKSEVRRDEIHDRFVIIVPSRSERPSDVSSRGPDPTKETQCPFCHEELLPKPPLLIVGPKKQWEVMVVLNKFPVVSPRNEKAYGYQEVIIETPQHNRELADLPLDHVLKILKVYVSRVKAIMNDKRIKYMIVFKNHGGKAGASFAHSHSQIFASEFIPPHIINKLTRAQNWRIKHGECYYCNLRKREQRGPRRIFSDKYFSAFTPYASIYNYEAWLFPHRHIDNITRMSEPELKSLAQALIRILKKVNAMGLPYNFYLHQAATDYDEHFYLRICPRRDVWAGIELGSRLIINTVSPEAAAKFYRS